MGLSLKVPGSFLLVFIHLVWIGNLCPAYSQQKEPKADLSPIHTAIPLLTIAPDARSSGMGDNGLTREPDVFSQYWNPAKYPFCAAPSGIGLSYTPWLRKWMNDMALISFSSYFHPDRSGQQAIGCSVRYFNLGEIRGMEDEAGGERPSLYPYELAIDISYSRRLSPSFSLGMTFRYLRSDMGIHITEEVSPANGFSIDLAGYGEKYILHQGVESLWNWGFNISDIGTRISYDGGKTYQFLPAMLRLGTGFLYPLNRDNRLGLYFGIHKYLVPSLPVYTGTTSGEKALYEEKLDKYNRMSSLKGVITSFSDAPGGFREELKELIFSAGTEYSYDQRLFFRAGYYHENKFKGNRQYLTVGAGILFKGIQADVSYLVSTVRDNPLDQTLRFSLSLDIQGIKEWLY